MHCLHWLTRSLNKTVHKSINQWLGILLNVSFRRIVTKLNWATPPLSTVFLESQIMRWVNPEAESQGRKVAMLPGKFLLFLPLIQWSIHLFISDGLSQVCGSDAGHPCGVLELALDPDPPTLCSLWWLPCPWSDGDILGRHPVHHRPGLAVFDMQHKNFIKINDSQNGPRLNSENV